MKIVVKLRIEKRSKQKLLSDKKFKQWKKIDKN